LASSADVQHLVAAQKERVWSLTGNGAVVYVCRNGGKMEPDVKAALGGDLSREASASSKH
jgi:sulfite reductase alpha subunit-like flavoprotein